MSCFLCFFLVSLVGVWDFIFVLLYLASSSLIFPTLVVTSLRLVLIQRSELAFICRNNHFFSSGTQLAAWPFICISHYILGRIS